MAKKATKSIANFRVDADLLAEAHAAAYWDRTTLTDVVVRALEEWVSRCRLKYNDGKPLERPD